jgi:PQQ enzyme repeat
VGRGRGGPQALDPLRADSPGSPERPPFITASSLTLASLWHMSGYFAILCHESGALGNARICVDAAPDRRFAASCRGGVVSVTQAVCRAVDYKGRFRETGFRAARRPRLRPRLRSRRRRQAAAAAVGLSLVIGPMAGAGSAAAAPGTPAAGPAPVPAAPLAGSGTGGTWPMAGANASNTRYQPDETVIGPGNVGGLVPKWTFRTAAGSGVWATPTEQGGVVYFPDSKGYLYAVDAATGHQIWSDYLPAILRGCPRRRCPGPARPWTAASLSSATSNPSTPPAPGPTCSR